jgi:hypothetical protein
MFMNLAVSASAIAKSWSGYFGYLIESNGGNVGHWLPILWSSKYFVHE